MVFSISHVRKLSLRDEVIDVLKATQWRAQVSQVSFGNMWRHLVLPTEWRVLLAFGGESPGTLLAVLQRTENYPAPSVSCVGGEKPSPLALAHDPGLEHPPVICVPLAAAFLIGFGV